MKLVVGYGDETYGTVEDTPQGLKFTGQVGKIKQVIRDVEMGPSHPDQHPDGYAGWLVWFARQLNNGYGEWCHVVTEQEARQS